MLKPGFEAKAGTYFRASIEACAGQFGKSSFTTQSPHSGSQRNIANERSVGLTLTRIVPNPTTDVTEIHYAHTEKCDVEISIVNVHGSVKRMLFNSGQRAGNHSVSLDISDVPAGVYYCVVRAGANMAVEILVRHE